MESRSFLERHVHSVFKGPHSYLSCLIQLSLCCDLARAHFPKQQPALMERSPSPPSTPPRPSSPEDPATSDPGSDQDLTVLSPLERLPSELTWIILEYVPESVFHLRSTSKSLLTRVDEFGLRGGATLPILSELEIFQSLPEENCTKIHLYMRAYKNKAALFELRFKLRKPAADFKEKIKRQIRDTDVSYLLMIDPSNVTAGMLDIMLSCIGMLIEQVRITNINAEPMFEAIFKMTEGATAQRLCVTDNEMTDFAATQILELARVLKFHQLTLYVETITNPVAFLLQISSLVGVITIEQENPDSAPENGQYFLGAVDVEWAPVIVDMFSRQELSKLEIFNFECSSRYLSNGSIEILKQRLPRLGKQIEFHASCNAGANQGHFEVEGHSVEVEERSITIEPLQR